MEPFVPPEPGPIPHPPPPQPGLAQDFNRLRQECLDNKQLFEDPDFPCDDSSLFYSGERPPYRVKWLRPGVSIVFLLFLLTKLMTRF